MKNTLLSLLFLTCILCAFGQDNQPPFIEVTGTAEMEVIPDEIYIAITIRERNNGNHRTVEEQEEALKNALKAIGLSLEDLEFSNAHADYIPIRWMNKKTVSQRQYRLKAKDAYMVGKIFEQLDLLNIQDAYISEVNHSKIHTFKKDVRINAIKTAKEKADYLLNAIGQRTGKALQVYEKNAGIYDNVNSNFRQKARASLQQFVGLIEDKEALDNTDIQFQKIKLKASVFVKFGIE